MKAMVLKQITDVKENPTPLNLVDIPIPTPLENELLINVSACGVCHTELDEIEGRTPPPHFPIIPGHQVVGEVVMRGASAKDFRIGDRVGIAWVYSSCGECKYCRSGNENLCPDFMATGRDANGGYGEYMIVPETSVHAIPEFFSSVEAAPLLCAGAIGYRSLMLTHHRDGERLGLTGFGASGHLVLKMITHRYPNSQVYVFARSPQEREFAIELGAEWAGNTTDSAPEKLDNIIDTTPVWKPVVEALKNLNPGGRLVINAIRKENDDKDYLMKLNYTTHLWMEKEIKSVANVTRRDVREFLDLAAEIPIKPEVSEYDLQGANQALYELKTQKIRGAKVLKM
jgi:propanol-preferring alcohol dehydrogenase